MASGSSSPCARTPEGVTVGDRLPDLRAPLADGGVFIVSEDAAGLPVAVVFAERPPPPSPELLIVHVARPGGETGLLSVLDDGSIAAALTPGDDEVAVVADAAHRVVAIGPPTELGELARRIPQPGPPVVRTTSAPILVVPSVVDAALRAGLRAHGDSAAWSPSPMPRAGDEGPELQLDDTKARDDILIEDEELGAELDRHLLRRLLPEVRRSLGHRITHHEQYKLVRYDAGNGWFDLHRDNTADSVRHRVLAVTINLDETNDAGHRPYEGGDLRFPELGPDLWRPAPGAAIVFSCGLLHEVTPVTSGTRHALVTFLF